MSQVWKYALEPEITIEMPCGSSILHIDGQFDNVCMWVLVDPSERDMESRTFYVFGTGHDIHAGDLEYLGTAMINGESLVFHVFEEIYP